MEGLSQVRKLALRASIGSFFEALMRGSRNRNTNGSDNPATGQQGRHAEGGASNRAMWGNTTGRSPQRSNPINGPDYTRGPACYNPKSPDLKKKFQPCKTGVFVPFHFSTRRRIDG